MSDPQPTPDPTPPVQVAPDLKFSQEALDRIVGQRLSEERQKFSDYDDLKAKADKLADLEREKQSDLERAQSSLTSIEKERDTAKSETETLGGQLTNARVRIAVMEAAPDKKIVSPKAAVKLLDLTKVEFGDDGEPQNIDSLLDDLVKEHDFLVAPTGPGFDGGARPVADADVSPGLGRLAHAYGQGSN